MEKQPKSIENLALENGVPVEHTKVWVDALYTALKDGGDPIGYLELKVKLMEGTRRGQVIFKQGEISRKPKEL